MVFKFMQKLLLIVICVSFLVGFKIFPGVKGWQLDPSQTATRKVFVTFPPAGKTLVNNLPGTDALTAAGANLTEAQIINSVLTDYNNIQSSYLMLVPDTDSDFAANNTSRRIIIEPGNASGVSSGEADVGFSGGAITSCKITITSAVYDDATRYVHLISHELGHCIGLDHPQETTNSVMSYFYQEDFYRLAIDDKMGIVHLYPKDPSYADEKPTLGMSCARQ